MSTPLLTDRETDVLLLWIAAGQVQPRYCRYPRLEQEIKNGYCHPFRTAGLVGSLIGGVSTFGASWVTQRKLLGTQTRMHYARQRQELYSEFIVEATKRLAEAWDHQAESPEVVGNLYSAVQRMRLVSSSKVVECAEEVMRGVIAAYAEPNRTFDELRQRVQQRSEANDYLREFTEACRQELSY